MSQTAVPMPGFFGKLPARGDFLARRLPAGFQTRWEDWLAGLVVAARESLGSAWPDDWLTAPIWHGLLGADIVGPAGAVVIVMASVDRVGRFFPFSLIAPSTPGAIALPDVWGRQGEALVFAALEDDFDPDVFDAALRNLGPPPSFIGRARPNGCWPLTIAADWPAPPEDALSADGFLPPGPAQSAWWCRGSARMDPVHFCCDGLPNAALSAAMITGAFGPLG